MVGAQLMYKSDLMRDEKPITNSFNYELLIDRANFRPDYALAYGDKLGKNLAIF